MRKCALQLRGIAEISHQLAALEAVLGLWGAGVGGLHIHQLQLSLNYGIQETSHETLRVCLLLDPDVEEMEDSEPRTAK